MDLTAHIESNVEAALAEDIGSGDRTAQLIPADQVARASIISREAAVLCGTAWFEACFRRLDAKVEIQWFARDGDQVTAGQTGRVFPAISSEFESACKRGMTGV